MGSQNTKVLAGLVLGLAFLSITVFTLAVGGVEGVILTNNGALISGGVMGLSPDLRINVPRAAYWYGSPEIARIPLASVRQITIDFPRLIVETADSVYLTPFSCVTGIAERLLVSDNGEIHDLPLTSLRAIALHGTALGDVPREWLGDAYLSSPRLALAPASEQKEPQTERTRASDDLIDFTQLYPETYVTETSPDENGLFSLLIFAGLAVAVYFLLTLAT